MEQNLWWGYIHTRGTVHIKRYFDKRDTDEAYESPFCQYIFGPTRNKEELEREIYNFNCEV